MKLKTLNEIIWKKNEHPKDIIKKEAIKWIKEFDKKESEELNNLKSDYDTVWAWDWIKHFFNITEKDLGEKK